MLVFSVHGPLDVPYYQGKAAKAISSKDASEFWRQHSAWKKRRGCYVFSVRAGKGATPLYVGKATKSFGQEVFTNDKLAKYQHGLADYLKGTPVVYLLAAPNRKGAVNKKLISELEDFLIQNALLKNPDLLNVQGTHQAEFGISGVLRGGKGKPSAASRSFKSCIGL